MEEKNKTISELEATLEEREGKKGKYFCISVKLTPTCENLFFLDNNQTEVVRLYYNNSVEKN